MNKKKQKKLLITFCVFLLLWNFPLVGAFETATPGASSLWVLVLMFVSWLIFIIVLWAIASLYMSDKNRPEE